MARIIEEATPEKKAIFLDSHILFEFKALFDTMRVNKSTLLKVPNEERALQLMVQSSSYEALLVHMRVLHDFFKDKISQSYPDDVSASDFIDDWKSMAKALVESLDKAWGKRAFEDHHLPPNHFNPYCTVEDHINKRLMHLSFSRDMLQHTILNGTIEHLKKLIKFFLEKLPTQYATKATRDFLETYEAELKPVEQRKTEVEYS